MMERTVQPERLDEMDPGEALAQGSRRDLVQVNRVMGNGRFLCHAMRQVPRPVKRLVELGAGDGTLLLEMARTLAEQWPSAHVTFVDQFDLVAPKTREAFAALDWTIEVQQVDVFDFLDSSASDGTDLMFANLFLHHFDADHLGRLLERVARRTRTFLAMEPRRCQRGLWAARGLGLIGCNRVTRHDGVVSVRAGFKGSELTRHWPSEPGWRLVEGRAGLFSHRFEAQR